MACDFGLSYTIHDYVRRGLDTELLVADLIEERCGGKCEKANLNDDKYKHVDLWWDSPKCGRLGIDVKGLKKNKRTDTITDDTIQWIEIQGVTGYKGWIYGAMDYIAFLTNSQVLFVKPSALYGKLLFEIAGKPLETRCPRDFYLPYRRNGRQDIVVKVPTKDIEVISHFKLSLS